MAIRTEFDVNRSSSLKVRPAHFRFSIFRHGGVPALGNFCATAWLYRLKRCILVRRNRKDLSSICFRCSHKGRWTRHEEIVVCQEGGPPRVGIYPGVSRSRDHTYLNPLQHQGHMAGSFCKLHRIKPQLPWSARCGDGGVCPKFDGKDHAHVRHPFGEGFHPCKLPSLLLVDRISSNNSSPGCWIADRSSRLMLSSSL